MNTKCIKDNKKLAADIPSASFFSFHHGEPSARVTGSGFLLTYYGICLALMSFFGCKKETGSFPVSLRCVYRLPEALMRSCGCELIEPSARLEA
ncbi:hypothetical protein P9148_18530 [Bacillus siamensis]|uniref:hypothetical protein n=1 Tax=Bacillus siamensis TaxID=659243 RepID=UPI002DB973DD|nr:hypothetical protein [Bacillus siamensis]MEC3657035.1 hypothetical protein [Bacillus siamensis]